MTLTSYRQDHLHATTPRHTRSGATTHCKLCHANPTRPAHDAPRRSARMLSILEHLRPVHKNVYHTRGILVRLFKGRMILHLVRIKNGNIRIVAWL